MKTWLLVRLFHRLAARAVAGVSLPAAALIVALPALVGAQTRVPQWPADYEYLGASFLPSNTPSAAGTVGASYGLVLRNEADGLHIWTASLVRTSTTDTWTVNDFLIPYNATTNRFSGPAIYKRTLGPTGHPNYSGIEARALYWDEPTQRLYATAGNGYDGDSRVFPTLTRLRLENGVLVREGIWSFDRRAYPYSVPNTTWDATKAANVTSDGSSDGMTLGGTIPVPAWWTAQFGGGRLAQFGGGHESGSAGRISMGPSLALFDPPAQADNTPIVAKAVLGYPYANSITQGIRRAPRDPNYINDFSKDGFVNTPTGLVHPNGGEDWPRTVTTPTGQWMHADFLRQSAAWIETPRFSALVVVAWPCANRGWYGPNFTPPTDGTPASLNCYGSKHTIYTYDPQELGAVMFGGKRQDFAVPAAFVDLQFPGLTYPIGCTAAGVPTGCKQSLPPTQFMVTGVAFEPTRAIFAVMVWDQSSSGARPRLAFWRVRDAASPDLPTAPFGLQVVTS